VVLRKGHNPYLYLKLQELIGGRGGARTTANRQRRQRAARPDTALTATTDKDSTAAVVGGILGELGYTGMVWYSIVWYSIVAPLSLGSPCCNV
jgi:hypothetical protein